MRFSRKDGRRVAKRRRQADTAAETDAVLLSIPTDAVDANPYQPRRTLDESGIKELAASIAEHGLLQPIVVRPAGDRYELLAGQRRLRACISLGMTHITAVLRQADDREVALLALVENVHRQQLSLFEEIEAIHVLIETLGATQTEVAHALGMSQSAIANKLRLLHLTAATREIISREMLSERHARALLAITDPEKQWQAARYIAKKQLNVRQAEQWIAQQLAPPQPKQRITGVFKDTRLFVNSVQSLVSQLQATGVPVEFDHQTHEEFVEVRVRIRTGKGDE